MKRNFKLIQIFLLIFGVIGVDEEKVKTVMEGDSVTLNSHLNQTQGIILLLWRFGDEGSTIAQINRKDISYPHLTEIFRGRLQLDQTGSLTINNMRTKHSGVYKLEMDLISGTSHITFNVAVSESPSVIGGGEAEMKSVSVMEGDPVTLQTDVTETQGDELIVWRFGDEGKLIAKCDLETKNSTLYETDERFRDRLKLDHQTGSLTITNTKTTDSELYTVKISSNKQTIYKRFIVTISGSGLSSGAVAGIVVVLLLVFAAAVAGVIYYRRKTSDLEKQNSAEVEPVSARERYDVTLKTDVPEIQRDVQIKWRIGPYLIAEIKGGTSKIYDDVLDGSFRNRLKLDQTGSLTITNIEMKHSGVYELKIKSGSEVSYKKFIIILEERKISVTEGKSVILKAETEIQRDDQILLMFEDNRIAQIKGGTGETFDVLDGRFRDRLELDEKTGYLTITNMRLDESGLYKLQIISSRGTTDKRLFVTVWEKQVSVYEGDPLILVTDTEIHKEDQILWLYEEKNSEIKGGIREITCDGADGKFKDRLKLDETTGSLTITDTKTTDSGVYKLQIKSSSGESYKKIRVHVRVEMISVKEGEPVTLKTNAGKQADAIQWTFQDDVIFDEKTGGNAKGIFRERLNVDKETGSLTIMNMRAEHAGVYKLQNTRGTLNKTFKVVVVCDTETKTVMGGEDVTLPSSTHIDVDEIVQWLFNDETLAIGIDGDINKTSYPIERFRNRLKLDPQTGSLTITNTRTSDTGDYHLKLVRCGIERKFIVTVSESEIPLTEGESVILNAETKIQTDDQILLMFEEKPIAQIKGGAKEKFDDVHERFRGRLDLDEKTGSLTITKMRLDESGLYKLQIISSRGNTNKRFNVTVWERNITVKEGESAILNAETEIQTDDQILLMCGENLIAQIKGGAKEKFDVLDGRFRDRLKLDKTTGSLTITNMRYEESGLYKLQIFSSKGNTDKRFNVTVLKRNITVIEGKLVILNAETEIQTDDQILLMFEENRIAQIKGGTGEKFDVLDERFRGRLELDKTTGSLTITHMRLGESGLYKLQISSSSRGTTDRRFFVTVLKALRPPHPCPSPVKPQEAATAPKPQSNKEIPDGENESVAVEMPLLSDVNDHQETSSL